MDKPTRAGAAAPEAKPKNVLDEGVVLSYLRKAGPTGVTSPQLFESMTTLGRIEELSGLIRDGAIKHSGTNFIHPDFKN